MRTCVLMRKHQVSSKKIFACILRIILFYVLSYMYISVLSLCPLSYTWIFTSLYLEIYSSILRVILPILSYTPFCIELYCTLYSEF